jgi:hypothetical protein
LEYTAAETVQTMTVFVVVHSPLVGALTWRPAARALEQKGHIAIVPALGSINPPHWARHANTIAGAIRAHGPGEPVVLVAHSAAGFVMPAASAALRDHGIRSYIFVDAVLPREGASLGDLIPASAGIGMKDVRAQATAGLLPAWGTGWSEDVWQRLIPDATLRAQFIQELRPAPLALYEERVPWPAVWPDAPCRYLRFSALYADEEQQARRSGWMTRAIAGEHLQMLAQPAEVAACLIDLA